jgi:hypothetical protein
MTKMKNNIFFLFLSTTFQSQLCQHRELGHEGDVLQQIAEGFDRRKDSPFALRKLVYAQEQGKSNGQTLPLPFKLSNSQTKNKTVY